MNMIILQGVTVIQVDKDEQIRSKIININFSYDNFDSSKSMILNFFLECF